MERLAHDSPKWLAALCCPLLCLSATVAACAATPSSPIAVTTIARHTTSGEPIRGLAARVDLRDPRIEVVVLPHRAADDPSTRAADSTLITVPDWARSANLDLAVNTNFFSTLTTPPAYQTGHAADIFGLCVSDGSEVSPPRAYAGRPDPALVFDAHRHGRILELTSAAGVFDGVAGIGASATDPDRGGLIVMAGRNLGANARVEPEKRHPRTAAGVSADGWTLLLVAIDGRQPEWSVGMTLPELADLMIELGAYDALNLDGGGSTSLFYRASSSSPELTNRPSDAGGFRPVASALGIRLHTVPCGHADEGRARPSPQD